MLIQLAQPKIYNSQGHEIILNAREVAHAKWIQKQMNDRFENDLGYEIPITTLSKIMKKVSEQKYFEIAPADYIPLRVGEGAWSSNLVTFRSFGMAGEFETGIVNTGAGNARLASADAGVDSLTVKVNNWAKTIGWSIMDLEMAAKSGNWDIVSAKEKERKRNWDLGIQRIAFLGASGLNGAGGSALGLLNQAGITTDSTTITKPISTMTTTELKTFTASLIEKFRANCNRTAWPTAFIIPESDYNGLASTASPDFPIKSTLELLEDSFKLITRNAGFKILPLAYGDAAFSGYSTQMYVLLNQDEEAIRMDVPVDYTNTMANSIDNFSFQNVAYGQFTGVQAYRPLEIMYFTAPIPA